MLTTFLYHKAQPLETNVSRAQMLQSLQDKDTLLWVDLEDPTEFESDTLVEIFNFHDLAIEDCLSDNPHPKVDDYEEYLFLVAHALEVDGGNSVQTRELDLFLGKNFVVTFHKEPFRAISQSRDNAPRKPDLYFGLGSDQLVHALLDDLVDGYLPVLDEYDSRVESLGEVIFHNPDSNVLTTLMEVKRDVFHLRRVLAPQRDMLNHLARTPSAFIKTKHLMYFRDVYDHAFQIYGTMDGLQEALNSILQVYFSYSSHRLNQMIQRMTILATLTMPAMIIASIYGMNFRNIPELSLRYGYFISLGAMFVVSVGMLLWMKFKKWF